MSGRTMSSREARVRIRRWGNGVAVRIPGWVTRQLDLRTGEELDVSVAGQTIVLQQTRDEATLEELLEGVTPERVGGEMNWGKPRGNEIW